MTVTSKQIIETLQSAQCGLSAKGFASKMNIDAPSEVLRNIADTCWSMVEAGELVAHDYREQKNGELFFSPISFAK